MAKKTGESDLADDVDDVVDDVEEIAEDVRDNGESWVEEKLLRTRERTRDEPITMLLIAAGIGALLGAIFIR